MVIMSILQLPTRRASPGFTGEDGDLLSGICEYFKRCALPRRWLSGYSQADKSQVRLSRVGYQHHRAMKRMEAMPSALSPRFVSLVLPLSFYQSKNSHPLRSVDPAQFLNLGISISKI